MATNHGIFCNKSQQRRFYDYPWRVAQTLYAAPGQHILCNSPNSNTVDMIITVL